MAYKFSDRLQEWTTYAGIAGAALAVAIPEFVPADTHWVQLWQGMQMLMGAAMIFIPQTAGTTAIENDSWALLRAFAKNAPPEYRAPMQPLLAILASHLAEAETGAPPSGNTPVAPVAPVPPAPAAAVAAISPFVANTPFPFAKANTTSSFTPPSPFHTPLELTPEMEVKEPAHAEPKPAPKPTVITPLVADPAATLRPIR